MKPVAIVGNLCWDRVDGGAPRAGGGVFHGARGLRAANRLGILVTRTAAEDRKPLLPSLVRLGLPVRWRPCRATAVFAIDYEDDVRHMRVEGVPEPLSAEDARGWVREALRGVEWVHVAPLFRSDFPAETLAELARGRRLSLDGQGLVRVGQVGPLTEDAAYDPEVLGHVSVLKLAEEEARLLVGDDLDERALGALGVPEVIVTLGYRGSIVFADGLAEHVPARRVYADPTGAGDAFAAVYLAARAIGAAPVAAACRATAAVADVLAGRAR